MATDSGTALEGRIGLRHATRAAEVGGVATRHLGPRLLRRRTRNAEHMAPALHATVVRLGPPFVKLSQVVASSPGLFPEAISDGLRDLLDDAPPEPWALIKATIEEELGMPVTEAFAAIDPHPMAAASIAQVHEARLADGRNVVVKVRRPNVAKAFERDLRLLRGIAKILDRTWPKARVMNPVGVVDDTISTLKLELDFAAEAAAMTRFGDNLRTFGDNERVRVPKVIPELSTSGVLTMERIDGIKVDDLFRLNATGLELTPLLRAGVRAWVESAAEHGFFHGDVHAGNLLLDTEGRVVFLDFGIMGELDDKTRQLVREGVVALLHERDFDEVTRCLLALGAHIAGGPIDEERAAAAIRRLAEPLLSKPLSELDYQEVFVSAITQGAAHGLQLPRELVLLVKQIIYFERYAKIVAPGYDILSDMSLIDFMIDESA